MVEEESEELDEKDKKKKKSKKDKEPKKQICLCRKIHEFKDYAYIIKSKRPLG